MRKFFILFVGVAVVMQFTWIGYVAAAGTVSDSDWTGKIGTDLEETDKLKLDLEDTASEKLASFAIGDALDTNEVTGGASARLSTGKIARAWALSAADAVKMRVHNGATSILDTEVLDFDVLTPIGGASCAVALSNVTVAPRNDGGYVVVTDYYESGRSTPTVTCGGIGNRDTFTVAAIYDGNFDPIDEVIDVNSAVCTETLDSKSCKVNNNGGNIGVFSDNSFVIVWVDTKDTSGTQVYAQHYGANGHAIGSPIGIDEDLGAGEDEEYPTVQVLNNDNYVVAWDSYTDRGDVYFQMMESDGDKIGSNVNVTNVTSAGEYGYYPDLALQSDGDFILSYAYGAGSDWPALVEIYSEAGVLKEGPVAVDGTSGEDQWNIDVAVGENDEFVVAYHDYKYSGTDYDIAISRFDADANQLDTPVRAVSDYDDSNGYPSLAYGGNDDYWLTWWAASDNNAYTLKWGRDYLPSGEYVSDTFTIPEGNAWTSADWTADVPVGTTFTVEVDTNGDGTYEEVTNGEDLYGSSLDTEPKESTELTYRLAFATTDGDATPELSLISFGYEDLLVLVGSKSSLPLSLAFISGLLITGLWYSRKDILARVKTK
ncbi:hypothetical protein ACFL1U_01030 [Patescibacteria group bacterium]